MTVSLNEELLNNETFRKESFRKKKPLHKWNIEDYIYRIKRTINSIRMKYYSLFPNDWRIFVQDWGWCFWSFFVILLIAFIWYIDAYFTLQN
jgi:hypothetical protein